MLCGCSGLTHSLTHADLAALQARVADLDLLKQLQRPPNLDQDELRRRLSAGWGTELLLLLSDVYATEDELVRISNTWGVVQAYYIGYHATQALMIANGEIRPSKHPATKGFFMRWWTERVKDLAPWSLAATAEGCLNLPTQVILEEKIPATALCDEQTCWSLAAKALRTTRQETVEDRFSGRRQEKVKKRLAEWEVQNAIRLAQGRDSKAKPRSSQLSQQERLDLSSKVRAHTLMDYLWRLRVNANYEDIIVFIEGPDTEAEALQLRRDLISITSSTLFVHELLIKEMVGRRTFLRIAEQWVSANTPPLMALGLASRLDLLASR